MAVSYKMLWKRQIKVDMGLPIKDQYEGFIRCLI